MAFQVEISIVRGQSGGLIIRSDPNSNGSGYYFRLSTDGTYVFKKIAVDANGNAQHTALVSGTTSAIKAAPNQANLMTIVARGSNFYLYVNKQYVDSASDDTYKSGEIGVFSESDTSGTEGVFRNAQVWKL